MLGQPSVTFDPRMTPGLGTQDRSGVTKATKTNLLASEPRAECARVGKAAVKQGV